MADQPPSIPPQPLSYSTPSSFAFQGGQNVPLMRAGNLLVTPPQIMLPQCCIICGKDPARRYEKTFYWSAPIWALTILIGVLVYLIIVLIVRKKGIVNYGLCAEHATKRSRGMYILTLSIVLSIITMIGLPIATIIMGEENIIPKQAGPLSASVFFLIGLIALIVLIAMSNRIVPGLKPRYINNYMMKLHGCGQPFLEPLPPFSDQQGFMVMAQGYAQ